MFLLNVSVSFPLQNPVLIFTLILFIILFAPIFLNRIKIPPLIGLIIAGAIIGPYGFNLVARDSSITLFGTVGLLYIMFLAGLEIDRTEFKKNSWKSLIFGFYTFAIPMGIGYLAGVYVLGFGMLSSILLASMFATHTLIAYPMISRMGVAKNRAVTITVGGTVITDTLALLVLAVVAGMATGDISEDFWYRLSISLVVFIAIVIFIYPFVIRWFFKHFDDNITQYIFVLVMLFLAAFLAEAAGVEPIIGAFFAGLSLNRLIPRTSPLMNRIEFVGNALFIPFFLLGVGMLVDYRAFITDINTIWVAAVITFVAVFSKFVAAWFTQISFRFKNLERKLIFGLSSASAAATLAIIMVGYNIILNQAEIDAAALFGEVVAPFRLFNESVLNGTIVAILVSCTVASFVAQRSAQKIALLEENEVSEDNEEGQEKIMVAVDDNEMTEELVNLALIVKSKSNKKSFYALNIIDNENADPLTDKNAKKILDKAAVTAAAADVHLHELIRYDLNIVNGITSVVKEHKITDLILGLQEKKGFSTNFVGNLTEGILTKCDTTTLIYKPSQPLSTIKRHLIVVPNRAEREIGFPFWLIKVWNIARNSGAKLVFYSSEQTLKYIKEVNKRHPIECEFINFVDWDDFLILSREVKSDDNLILVLSRKERPSYHSNMTKIPNYLNKYFTETNFILIFPMQSGISDESIASLKNPSVLGDPLEKLDDFGKMVTSLFKKKLK
ncbi:MAG: cation:proton antiporter [Bacteroidales bacterium]|jgi:Kef-type K+ transport system membrane component KefB/nucleotide-binding universal stress UspA family protein|nr:cation:proton antiporter [Bacteroidales bacterium]